MARWKIDPDHSVAFFAVRHFMITDVRGQFNQVSGTILFDADDPPATAMEFRIGVASLFTGVAKRDQDLLSPRFFDVDHFPDMSFKSTAVRMTAWNRCRISGIFNIKGQDRMLTVDGEFSGPVQGPQEVGGETCIGFALTGCLDLDEAGFPWTLPMAKYGTLVGRQSRLWVNLEADLE
jgi:polyisoprenoid-binding protein YceI